MNNFIVIAIIIVNIFLKYVLGFINNIIIILVIYTSSGHVFLKECCATLSGISTQHQNHLSEHPGFFCIWATSKGYIDEMQIT